MQESPVHLHAFNCGVMHETITHKGAGVDISGLSKRSLQFLERCDGRCALFGNWVRTQGFVTSGVRFIRGLGAVCQGAIVLLALGRRSPSWTGALGRHRRSKVAARRTP